MLHWFECTVREKEGVDPPDERKSQFNSIDIGPGRRHQEPTDQVPIKWSLLLFSFAFQFTNFKLQITKIGRNSRHLSCARDTDNLHAYFENARPISNQLTYGLANRPHESYLLLNWQDSSFKVQWNHNEYRFPSFQELINKYFYLLGNLFKIFYIVTQTNQAK